MALSIHTYSSLVTQTNLSKTNNALGTNQQRWAPACASTAPPTTPPVCRSPPA